MPFLTGLTSTLAHQHDTKICTSSHETQSEHCCTSYLFIFFILTNRLFADEFTLSMQMYGLDLLFFIFLILYFCSCSNAHSSCYFDSSPLPRSLYDWFGLFSCLYVGLHNRITNRLNLIESFTKDGLCFNSVMIGIRIWVQELFELFIILPITLDLCSLGACSNETVPEFWFILGRFQLAD